MVVSFALEVAVARARRNSRRVVVVGACMMPKIAASAIVPTFR